MDNNKVLKDLIWAGFGHFGGYNQTTKNYLHRIMMVACDMGLAYPFDFGRGKGKYKTNNVDVKEVIEGLKNNPEAIAITEKFINYRNRQ